MLINKLRLDKGFPEESFAIRMHRSTIITIAVIILGGWMFIDSLPMVIQQVYRYFVIKDLSGTLIKGSDFDFSWAIFYAVKTFISIFMIVYCRDIVNFIELQRKRSGSTLFIQPSEETPKPAEPGNELLKHYED